jgi:carotenoid cleavage dioxygenase-like enzyme
MQKVDLFAKKVVARLTFPNGCIGGESVFVSREGGDGEDDGYLLNFVHNETTNKTALWVVDATNFVKVSQVDMPGRIPYGLHGLFVSAEEMKVNVGGPRPIARL